jgi:ferredoxin--NADP+ reductase
MHTAPLRVALIGSGPASCFTAEELLRAGHPVAITMFERLDQPFGLVRYGVAPDHPHTRRMITLLERTAAAVTLRSGVEIGRDMTLDQLRRDFDVIVAATGAEEDRTLGIPGEHLAGVHSSLSFAGWVNGHPDYAHTRFDFDTPTAVIIGQGNVALDIVRLLCHDEARLRETDMAPAALATLARSRVKNIHVIGRRGPAQASFGENEIAELGDLPGVDLRVDPIVTMPGPADEIELAAEKADRVRAVVQTLRGFASRPSPAEIRRTVSIDFLRRPLGLAGAGRVEEITLELTRLEGEPGSQMAVPTGALQKLECGLVFSAIGHRARPLPGLPFDAVRGVIPTRDHRVVDGDQVLPGLYAVGWVKRGAKGLIGHNRRDAMETVAALLSDWRTQR